jgi:hypothetical protein
MPHWDADKQARNVVYVHGIGNKVASPKLKLSWDHALFNRNLAERSIMAYWADIRYERPILEPGDLAPQEFGPGDAVMPPETSQGDGVPTTDFSEAYARELLMTYSVEQSGAESFVIDPTRPIPSLVRRPGFWLASRVFIKDAHAYFFDRDQRAAIADRLRDALRAAEEPILLLGHSLGSIISYDILHEDEFRDIQLVAFITFGSQLGVRAVQDHVRNPLEVPPAARARWHNYLDKDDLSPMRRLLTPFFRPYDIEDHWVENPSPNDHDGVSYLSETRLRSAADRLAT